MWQGTRNYSSIAVHNHTPFLARGLEAEGVVFLLMYINDG
jgi:hypothetical protein